MISQISSIPSQRLSDELFGVFIERKREIRDLVQRASTEIVESVHLVRKHLKFLRAFVKLTQFCSTGEKYKEINILFRDCGRFISECRDAHVRALLLEEFKISSDYSFLNSVISALFEENLSETDKIENKLFEKKNVFEEILAELEQESVSNYFAELQPEAELLYTGYALCYEKSYNAFHTEVVNHKAELLHEWRKRTKDLQYQQEVLMTSIPDDLPPSFEDVAHLCDLLGRINDLYMISEWMRESVITEDINGLIKTIDEEIKSLQSVAYRHGHSLYGLNPVEYRESLQKLVHV